ncbi:uncharacterized protein LY79DRAFT_550134 [Colletotrichum navitas]|uniref:Uncharacterized protein n=1 Tax=Colletotrichum navitas TaxID=681940 RepID=A0AAD8Q347_9PEZI|nr:uncharacterized protein LY79DRAFT_550134 [Colletotrichum navitas]KAK1594207.1 hypothetical protein LY79DRAFT_550134 [Colletotrichum navitas]
MLHFPSLLLSSFPNISTVRGADNKRACKHHHRHHHGRPVGLTASHTLAFLGTCQCQALYRELPNLRAYYLPT